MLRHFITSIDYQKLIEIQANEANARVSRSEMNTNYKNSNQQKKNIKVRKIGQK